MENDFFVGNVIVNLSSDEGDGNENLLYYF